MTANRRGLRAFIYVRVSRDPKANGRSVAEQEAECRAICERSGWVVVRVFSDPNRSASRHARRPRPGYQEMLSAIGECDVIVVWESSRSQRGLGEYVALRDLCAELGVLFSYKGRTYDLGRTDDRFSSGVDALVDERYADETRDRILRSTRANAAKGRPHGKLLYGYTREYDSSSGELLRQVIDQTQAKVIREAANRFLGGETPYAIANDFNRRGITAARGGAWNLTQIRRVLVNPSYNGKRVFQKKVMGDAAWPAILDDSTFNQCVAKFADPRRRTSRDSSIKHLLTGIAKCGVCGKPLKYGKPRGKPSYVCHPAAHVARHMAQTEEIVTELILARLELADAQVLFERQDSGTETMRAEITEKRTRLDGFYDAAAAGEISARALARIEGQLLAETADLEKKMRRVDVPLVVAQMANQPRKVWATLSITQRRDVIRSLVEIRVLKMRKGARPVPPESIAVDWIGRS